MAKAKQHSVQNRHIYSRASYLYQAAHYLASTDSPTQHECSTKPNERRALKGFQEAHKGRASRNLSRQMITDMRAVTQKLLIRQSPELKRTICKVCDTLQIEGQTCHSTVENDSKGGRKSWADVLAISCHTCGNVKRFPVSGPRQKRRPLRNESVVAATGTTTAECQTPVT